MLMLLFELPLSMTREHIWIMTASNIDAAVWATGKYHLEHMWIITTSHTDAAVCAEV